MSIRQWWKTRRDKADSRRVAALEQERLEREEKRTELREITLEVCSDLSKQIGLMFSSSEGDSMRYSASKDSSRSVVYASKGDSVYEVVVFQSGGFTVRKI